jgi:hypothetical protein
MAPIRDLLDRIKPKIFREITLTHSRLLASF